MEQQKNEVNIKISAGTVFKVLLCLVFFYLVYFLRDIALIILTAIVIASAMEPATKWFQKRKVPRVLGVVLIYFFVIATLLVLFYFLLPPLLSDAYNFVSNVNSFQVTNPLKGIFPGGDSQIAGLVDKFSLQGMLQNIQDFISGFSGGFIATISKIFGGAISFILILVLSFYFTVHENGVADFLTVIAPKKHQPYIINLWERSQHKIGLWLQGQLLLGVLVGVFVFLGLTLVQVKHALLLAVLAAIFEIIPLFGPILSAIPGILSAFVTGGLTLAVIVLLIYLVIQQFENHLIYPLVVNKVVGVSPILVIIALLVGAKLAGFLGVVMSVPIAAALMEYYGDVKKDKLGLTDMPLEKIRPVKQK